MTDLPVTAVLFDYGEVLTEAQPDADVAAMADVVGLDLPEFQRGYWAARAAYDRGGSAEDFWRAVAGRDVDGADLAALVRLDVDAWLHLEPAAMAVVAELQARGVRLALLSNAPHELADAVDAHPGFAAFAPRLFSARLGLTKPDPEIFAVAVARLGVPAGEVLFLDDRTDNVAAARAAGLQARQVPDAARLREHLTQVLGA